jgi:hypothetical protein
MKTKLIFAVAGLALIAAPAYSQDVAGTWTGETQGRGGPQEMTLTLVVNDGELTGTIVQGQQPEGEITDGMVNGASISFSRSLETGRGAFTLGYTGEVDGDELTLTIVPPEGGFGGGGGGRGGGAPGGGRGGGFGAPIVLTRQ